MYDCLPGGDQLRLVRNSNLRQRLRIGRLFELGRANLRAVKHITVYQRHRVGSSKVSLVLLLASKMLHFLLMLSLTDRWKYICSKYKDGVAAAGDCSFSQNKLNSGGTASTTTTEFVEALAYYNFNVWAPAPDTGQSESKTQEAICKRWTDHQTERAADMQVGSGVRVPGLHRDPHGVCRLMDFLVAMWPTQ